MAEVIGRHTRTELLHYSNRPVHLEQLESYVQEPDLNSKPKGLWVSDGAAWKDWCVAESFDPGVGGHGGLELAHVVKLQPSASILTLTTVRDILQFTDAYVVYNDHFPRHLGSYKLDWAAIAGAYSGIMIMPYQWELRLSQLTPWYYGWDVSSGCIWEPTAIASIRTLCPGVPHTGHASSDWTCPYAREPYEAESSSS